MSYQFLKIENADHVFTITINRPEVLNALHAPGKAEMGKAFDEFAADDDAWVAIVTGSGDRAFSAGNDLKVTASGEQFDVKMSGGFGGITDRHDLFKPVIAACNGLALGGGFEIALGCDIIIASDTAYFGLPEPRVGLVAGAGGIHRLPRMLPLKIAMGMMLRGKPITAEEALRWGVVNEVVPQDQVLPTARRWAAEIMECAPLSVRLSKEAAMKNLHLTIEEALHRETPLREVWFNSHDRIEGPVAFAEKRKPIWQGK